MTGERPRTPRPPEPVREWVERYAGVKVEDGPREIREGACRALQEALRRPGRNREGAHALLAADALLTYAVEDLADVEDPEGGLRLLLHLVVEQARGGMAEPAPEGMAEPAPEGMADSAPEGSE